MLVMKGFLAPLLHANMLTNVWFDKRMASMQFLEHLLAQFESEGQLPGATNGSYVTGATSASVSLSPMETAEITIVLGWFYPDRDFLGLPVGQYTVHTDTYTCIHVC